MRRVSKSPKGAKRSPLGIRRSGGRNGITYVAAKVRPGAKHMRTSENVVKIVHDLRRVSKLPKGAKRSPLGRRKSSGRNAITYTARKVALAQRT